MSRRKAPSHSQKLSKGMFHLCTDPKGARGIGRSSTVAKELLDTSPCLAPLQSLQNQSIQYAVGHVYRAPRMATQLDFWWDRPTNPRLTSVTFPGASSTSWLPSSPLPSQGTLPPHLPPGIFAGLPGSEPTKSSLVLAIGRQQITCAVPQWRKGCGWGALLHSVRQVVLSVLFFHWESRAESLSPASYMTLPPPSLGHHRLCPWLNSARSVRLQEAKQSLTFQQDL